MAAGIKEVRERAAILIEASVPDVDSSILFKEISGKLPIERQPHTGSASQTTRQFQIRSIPIDDEGFLGGCSVDQRQRIRVTVRYYSTDERSDWQTVTDRMGADSARIEEVLLRPSLESNWTGTPLLGIWLDSAEGPFDSDVQNMAYMSMDFEVLYRLDQEQASSVLVRSFNTLAEVREYLDTVNAGDISRLANARTTETIGYWLQRSDGTASLLGDCNWAKADGGEFMIAADGDIRPRGAGTASITYGTGLVVAGEGVQFWGARELTDRDYLHVGTHATYAIPTQRYLGEFFAVGDLPSPANTDDVAYVVSESTGAVSDLYRYDGAVWNACGGGSSSITDYSTQALLFAVTPTAGLRASLVRDATGVVCGIYQADGTRWRLDGELNLAAMGSDGGTMLAGYISTVNASASWGASGLTVTPSATITWGVAQLTVVSSGVRVGDANAHPLVSVHAKADMSPFNNRRITACGVHLVPDAGGTRFISGGVDYRNSSGSSTYAFCVFGDPAAPSFSFGGSVVGYDDDVSLSSTAGMAGSTYTVDATVTNAIVTNATDTTFASSVVGAGGVEGVALTAWSQAATPLASTFSSVSMAWGDP